MLKKLLKRVVYQEKYDSSSYIKYLRKIGCTIGNDCVIYVPSKTYIDITRPYLINIGNDVKITEGVTILSHGYDWSVLEEKYHEILGCAGEVVIGNNVFIGMKSIILKGVHIGNNVIIGAGSLVNKDIPDNVVWGGVPAAYIMSIDDYYKKRKNLQLDEAYIIYKNYRDRWNTKEIPRECFHEFFWLFKCEIKNNEISCPCWGDMMKSRDYEIYHYKEKIFKSYDEFLTYCSKRYENDIKTEGMA